MPKPILAGIPAGGMKETYEVKILICYLLKAVGKPLTRENICEVCCADGIVDYFTLCTALQELEQNGNICPLGMEEDAAFSLTPLGEETVENLKKALPSSLRDIIVRRGMNLLAKIRRENEVSTQITMDGSGFQVSASLHQGGVTFFSMSFYAPDAEQAQIIARNFQKQAGAIYETLIFRLTE
ncbi:MAG: DUF4364 family protein [Candidatus Merdivicinus sp.]|jgi:hypothetical protein